MENPQSDVSAWPVGKDSRAVHKGGLVIILDRHYDAGTDRYSDKILDRLVGERRLQYEQGQTTRALYQNLRKSAYWLREMHRTGNITVGRIPNWGQREPVEPFQTLLKEFSVSAERTMAKTSLKVARSAVRRFLFELEDHGFSTLSDISPINVNRCVTSLLHIMPVGWVPQSLVYGCSCIFCMNAA